MDTRVDTTMKIEYITDGLPENYCIQVNSFKKGTILEYIPEYRNHAIKHGKGYKAFKKENLARNAIKKHHEIMTRS